MDTHVEVTGWGQVTQPKDTDTPLDVTGLMIQAARQAGRTLADPALLSKLDGILVVRPLSAHCPDAPAQVAGALGADPGFTHISDIGGNSPQTLINLAGSLIAENRLERVLVVGA
jgi:acetyl-CoA C-acetyltransferase